MPECVRACVRACVPQAAGRRVVDAGTKAVDLLCGMPKLAAIDETVPLAPGLEDVCFRNGGDEHGVLTGVPRGARHGVVRCRG